MKKNQHISLFIIFLLCISGSVLAQTRVADTKLMALRGQVKSVVESSKAISGYTEWVLKDRTKYQTTSLFDSDGYLTEEIHEGQSNFKYAYSTIDGHKTFKRIDLPAPPRSGPQFTVLGDRDEKPIEPNEKLTEPDKRFEFKYTYETDQGGKTIIERQYQNNGKLFRKRTLVFSDAGTLTRKIEEDSGAIENHSYGYDDKGNLVEDRSTRHIKGPGTDSRDRTTYTEMKFDSKGNWIERKITTYSDVGPEPQYNIPAAKYTLVNMQRRTITYY